MDNHEMTFLGENQITPQHIISQQNTTFKVANNKSSLFYRELNVINDFVNVLFALLMPLDQV